jgi:hypothetical protein
MVKFEVPSADTPGFLRRQKKLMEFIACPDDSPDKWGLLAVMLIDYVVKPTDSDEAEKAIWDMSENEYSDVLALISKQGEVSKNK